MIPESLVAQVIDGFAQTLRQDNSWRGDLSDEEREVWIMAACSYLLLRA